MRKWILASQAEKQGRLYWSTQRGWTYLELASLYREPTRETLSPADIFHAEPVWFEAEVDVRGFVKVIEPQERPDFARQPNFLNELGDLSLIAFTPRAGQGSRFAGQVPDRVQVYRGYNINTFVHKAAS
jgi:hypothetical protein